MKDRLRVGRSFDLILSLFTLILVHVILEQL